MTTTLLRGWRLLALCLISLALRAEIPPTIPLAELFADAEMQAVQISPTGRYLTWLAPKNQRMNLAISPTTIGAQHYFILGAILFTIGATGLLLRRNAIVMFMCVELMLNAVNLTFVTFAKALNDSAGQAAVFFTLIVAAAEVAVGLAIIVAIFRRRQGVTADDIDLMKG